VENAVERRPRDARDPAQLGYRGAIVRVERAQHRKRARYAASIIIMGHGAII
jgi:hypothetical protein